MAANNDMQKKLLADTQGGVQEVEAVAKKSCKVLAIGYSVLCVVILFVLTWLVQGFLYFLATTANGCRAGALENYNYIKAGAAKSSNHDEAYNIMPQNSYLTERTKTFYGYSFQVQPIGGSSGGQDGSGALASAAVGNWWLSWGPIFNTYTYEDVVDSQTLLWMRRSLFRLGQSHRVGRCDGTGALIEFEEGTNWFGNKIKHLTGATQAISLKVFVDNNDGKGRQWVATLEEQNQGTPGITLVSKTNDITSVVANSVLHNHQEALQGHHAQWYVQNNEVNTLPYYLLSAVTLLYAFNIKGQVQRGDAAVNMAQLFVQNSTAVSERSMKLQMHI